MKKNYLGKLVRTMTCVIFLLGSGHPSSSSSTSIFTTSLTSASGSTDSNSTSDTTNIINITMSSSTSSTGSTTDIASTPTNIATSTTIGMDRTPISSTGSTSNAFNTQSTSSTTRSSPSRTGALTNRITSEAYSIRKNITVKSRHENPLVYAVAPVVCFVSFICLIAIICIIKEARREERPNVRVWSMDPEQPNIARKSRGIAGRNDETERKICMRCFPKRKNNLTIKNKKKTHYKESIKTGDKEAQMKQFVVFYPSDKNTTESENKQTNDVSSRKDEENGQYLPEKSTDLRESKLQQKEENEEVERLDSEKVDQEIQTQKSMMDPETTLEKEIAEVRGEETTLAMNERRTPFGQDIEEELLRNVEMYIKLEEHEKSDFQVQVGEGNGKQNHGMEKSYRNLQQKEENEEVEHLDSEKVDQEIQTQKSMMDPETTLEKEIAEVRGEETTLAINERRTPFGQDAEEELLRNAEMCIKLEEHEKSDFQVQVGEGNGEQNHHGMENGMNTAVEMEELIDILKEIDESTDSMKSTQENLDGHLADSVVENQPFENLPEEKRENTRNAEFDQWDSSSDEEESNGKSEAIPVKHDLENEMQSSETSSRGSFLTGDQVHGKPWKTSHLKDADVQTHDVHFTSKGSRGRENRQERIKRRKGTETLSLKRKTEISRDSKDDTIFRAGVKFSETSKVQQREFKNNPSVPFDSKLKAEARKRYSRRLSQIIGVYSPGWLNPQQIKKESKIINVREAPMDQYVRSRRLEPYEARQQSTGSDHSSNTDEETKFSTLFSRGTKE